MMGVLGSIPIRAWTTPVSSKNEIYEDACVPKILDVLNEKLQAFLEEFSNLDRIAELR